MPFLHKFNFSQLKSVCGRNEFSAYRKAHPPIRTALLGGSSYSVWWVVENTAQTTTLAHPGRLVLAHVNTGFNFINLTDCWISDFDPLKAQPLNCCVHYLFPTAAGFVFVNGKPSIQCMQIVQAGTGILVLYCSSEITIRVSGLSWPMVCIFRKFGCCHFTQIWPTKNINKSADYTLLSICNLA